MPFVKSIMRKFADYDQCSKILLVCILSHSHFLQISRELRQVAWGSAVSLYLKEGIVICIFVPRQVRRNTSSQKAEEQLSYGVGLFTLEK
jgi:hypothetical protein